MEPVVRVARRRIQREHVTVCDGIDYCADQVVADWTSDRVTDREAVVEPLRDCLESSGILDRLPLVLSDAVDATGHELAATPVGAPPYVVVTSRGPVLRATIDPGRLVIRFDAFEVCSGSEFDSRFGSETGYRRLENGLCLSVSLK
ncbi:hypothetical protein [Natronoglomus mannanivorans]|uniref:DUF7988 domain-containing protein n=1 Tax=Natronoglomus mannanivorans TaxID=2979990 RepID=A0AAP2Z0A2_9EURY|nr:hypothetical protein [Halobacteria archaeon AArc-xg1-1]